MASTSTPPAAATPATVPPLLAASGDLIRPALRAAVGQLEPRVAEIAGYHLGWLDADGRPASAYPGKMLRGAMVLLSARACGVEAERGVPGAVAVELVHNFSLLHDDVMDGDEQRRHRPAAWAVFGAPAAILAGDALLTLAFGVLSDGADTAADVYTQATRHLSSAMQRVCSGQMSDLELARRADPTRPRPPVLPRCLAAAADKTGALIGAACAVGAALAAAPAPLVTALEGFGEHVGMAFQIIDDILDIWGDPASTGKPFRSDLRNRRTSIPVAAALDGSTASAHRLACLYARQGEFTDDEVALVAALVEDAGGRAWAEAEIGRHADAAARHLDAFGASSPRTAEFMAFVDFITSRER